MAPPYTFHVGSVKVAHNLLQTLANILHKAEEHPNAASFLDARLIEDMYTLRDQIRLSVQYLEHIVARVTNRDPITYEKPTSFAQSYEFINQVVTAAAQADPEAVNQQADVVKSSFLGKMEADMSTADYVHMALLPNVYFHVTTAYGILRKEGVKLEKWDFYSGFAADLKPVPRA
ncbi:hypothetical protein POX_f07951 [Penicillium oxalicum]|uniref:hypothetical protein n=1 Tax=Penicillium oxalicum TaxID=69781 RepID=UPI0020B77AAE|nr:hypothetical protein POX_f07951 [Penicillium oxalicum]KAI2787579.1 hypothetical protein POX_f07951 [Penicillium oxalicum]